MIEINLLPGSTGRSARRGVPGLGALLRAKSAPGPRLDRALLLTVLAWVAGFGVLGYLHVSSTTRLADVTAEEAAAVRDSARFAILLTQGDSLNAQDSIIAQKMKLIQDIDAGRFIWAHIMDEVSAALPPYVWLSVIAQIASEPDRPAARLEGFAGNYFALGRYIEDLEASPFLSDVRLVSSSRTTVDDRNVLAYILDIRYEEPAPDAIQTVPLFAAQQEN